MKNKSLMSIGLVFFMVFLQTVVYAQQSENAEEVRSIVVDEETKKVCNEVMLKIYHDILSVKDKYFELGQFDEKTLYENEHGIYAIVYKYEKTPKQVRRRPFEFGITITDMDNLIFNDKIRYVFNLGFPLVDIKFAGYQIRHSSRYRFDIGELINKHGLLLADYQQTFMPLKLKLRTKKDTHYIFERIHFTVELENVSNKHMWVKTLGDKSLYCLFNDKKWGANPIKKADAKDVVLKSGDSITREFLGEEFRQPKDIEIYCSYNMSIKGVKPSGILKVRVMNE